MRRLDFSYTMQLDFSQAIRHHAFQLRCLPQERNGQHLESLQLQIFPDVLYATGTDGFGNTVCFGTAEAEHTSFAFTVSGIASLSHPYLPDSPVQAAKYTLQTLYTQPGPAIRMLHRQTPLHSDTYQRALALMHTVRAEIAYIPASTTTYTTAEEAAAQRCGVCQDHAQILLSLLRLDRIPCRYVSGLLLGEGRTHAWVEAYIGGCWVGLDATNGMEVHDTHICLNVGRDHADCEINRGIMLGSAAQTQTVQVCVKETI